ncbi:MAG: FtsX-like permease family protein [Marinilabiliales bacterium]|nr:MAG: FtsX-like permease family protein [Marinilabiliales bacterium]
MLYVISQYSTDRFHENRDRIVRVEFNNQVINPPQNADFLAENFPGIEKVSRIDFYNSSPSFEYGDKSYRFSNIIWADSTFFDIFSFRLLQGNRGSILASPYEIVITESLASRVFGNGSPVGRVIYMRNNQPFTVTGVMEDPPPNSTIQAEAVGSFLSVPWIMGFSELGELSSYANFSIYLLLAGGADAGLLEEDIYRERFENSGLTDEDEFSLTVRLRPLGETYFAEGVEFDRGIRKGNRPFVLIFLTSAVFILLIAAINFINLSTAAASTRAREIGVRKVAGAGRSVLVLQFLVETVILCLAAGIIAVAVVELTLPPFNRLVLANMHIDYLSGFLLIVLSGAVILGLVAGLYPAFYLTGFSPVTVLKGGTGTGPAGGLFRKVLIVVQYVISIILIISTLVVTSQIRFMKNKDLGFDSSNIVCFSLTEQEQHQSKDLIRERMLKHPGILDLAYSNNIPGRVMMKQGFYYLDEVNSFYSLPVTEDYIRLMGLRIAEGRDFIEGSIYDRENGYIINRTAARMIYGDEPAAGKRFRLWEREEFGEVIGVVEDFNFHSLHNDIEPLVIYYRPDWCSVVNLKLRPGSEAEALVHIENVWSELFPAASLNYYFLDDSFEYLYRTEERFGRMFGNAALLAIFIASIGLYGLTSFIVLRRTREIGIRKVMGAGELQVTAMIVGDFTRWVIIANIIAWPLAWYLMQEWLAGFAYSTTAGIHLFIAAGVLAWLISLATVSSLALRAARTNPADSLRDE